MIHEEPHEEAFHLKRIRAALLSARYCAQKICPAALPHHFEHISPIRRGKKTNCLFTRWAVFQLESWLFTLNHCIYPQTLSRLTHPAYFSFNVSVPHNHIGRVKLWPLSGIHTCLKNAKDVDSWSASDLLHFFYLTPLTRKMLRHLNEVDTNSWIFKPALASILFQGHSISFLRYEVSTNVSAACIKRKFAYVIRE